jgi:hypothetical protein
MSPPNSSRSFGTIVASVDPKPADRAPVCVLHDSFQIGLEGYPPRRNKQTLGCNACRKETERRIPHA